MPSVGLGGSISWLDENAAKHEEILPPPFAKLCAACSDDLSVHLLSDNLVHPATYDGNQPGTDSDEEGRHK